MTRLERLYHIHDLLRESRHPVPMRRFKEELCCSRNAVTRDFTFMRDYLHAPLIYDRDRNGYRYDPAAPVFELPGFWMNASELHALLACEQLLESVQPGLMTPRLAPLRGRIRELLGESGHDAEQLNNRIRVQPVAMRQVSQSVFDPVAEATLGSKPLAFSYFGRRRNQAAERQTHPQRLLHYRHNWYLLALCEKSGELRLFSLDRITSPAVGEAGWVRVGDEILDSFTDAGFGIFSGEARDTAHLRFSPEAARWVAEETWHPDQRGEWRDDGYHLHVPYSNPTELLMDILRHGPEVEVLGPAGLREEVREKVQKMLKIYCPHGQ